jgi:hypothetical protein
MCGSLKYRLHLVVLEGRECCVLRIPCHNPLRDPAPCREAVSQSRNIATGDLRGAMGVSFKMRKRRETGKDCASGGQRRRAAQLHQSFPCFTLHGCSREALRPPVLPPVGPHPSPEADCGATTSSFLYFERDPHGPDIHSRGGLEDRLPAGGRVVVLFVKELLGRHIRLLRGAERQVAARR